MNRDRQEADRRQLLTCEQPMLELTPTDPIVKTYLKDLHDLKHHLVTHELVACRSQNVSMSPPLQSGLGFGMIERKRPQIGLTIAPNPDRQGGDA
jgi:hypothetical protein